MYPRKSNSSHHPVNKVVNNEVITISNAAITVMFPNKEEISLGSIHPTAQLAKNTGTVERIIVQKPKQISLNEKRLILNPRLLNDRLSTNLQQTKMDIVMMPGIMRLPIIGKLKSIGITPLRIQPNTRKPPNTMTGRKKPKIRRVHREYFSLPISRFYSNIPKRGALDPFFIPYPRSVQ